MMKTGRDSFLLYKSFYGPIKGLSDEQLGRLLRAIFEWQINGQPGALGDDIEIAFGFFANQFKVDEAKYQTRCAKNRENIIKRWNHSTYHDSIEYNRIQSNTKHTYNDNDNDNENDSLRRKELLLPYQSPEFVDTWNELRTQPKWKRKTLTALQKNLDKLGKYPEEYAIILMDQAIANGYQGVVFPNTSTSFEIWKKNNPSRPYHREGTLLSKEELL